MLDQNFNLTAFHLVPISALENSIFTSTLFLLLLVSISLNSIVIALYAKDQKIRRATVMYLPLMTCSDIFVAVWQTLQYFLIRYTNFQLTNIPLCVTFFAFGTAFYFQSQYFIFLMFFYRYIQISRPLTYQQYLSTRRITCTVIISVSIVTVGSLFPLLTSYLDYDEIGSCRGYYKYLSNYLPIFLIFFYPLFSDHLYSI